jgi:GT2 family glycosyltransferase
MTIYPQGSLDIRIKFRDDQPYIVFKKTIQSEDTQVSEKIEVDKPITIEEMYRVIYLYKLLDVEKAIVSSVENYHFQIDEFDFSIKIGSEIGAFWEIDTVYDEETKDEDKEAVRSQMLDIIQKLGLTTWTQEEFKQVNKNSRHNRITVSYSHENEWKDLIAHIDRHLKLSRANVFDKKQKLSDKLDKTDNRYDHLERSFHSILGRNFLEKDASLPNNDQQQLVNSLVNDSVYSIVVPYYNDSARINYLLKSITLQTNHKHNPPWEMIIINDGSSEEETSLLENYAKQYETLNIKIVHLKSNHGRSHARNIGAEIATGETIIFLDSDTILSYNYIAEHLILHRLHHKVVALSFKENASTHDKRVTALMNDSSLRPEDIEPTDFRLGREIKPDWTAMHPTPDQPAYVSCLHQTNNFKEFGNHKIVGVWSLPGMVVTHNLSVSKHGLSATGGFNSQFKGWGMEDTFFGAQLIGEGYYIVPVVSAPVLHINHDGRGEDDKTIKEQYINNIKKYKELLMQY